MSKKPRIAKEIGVNFFKSQVTRRKRLFRLAGQDKDGTLIIDGEGVMVNLEHTPIRCGPGYAYSARLINIGYSVLDGYIPYPKIPTVVEEVKKQKRKKREKQVE